MQLSPLKQLILLGLKGHAIAHTPRSAPFLRSPVGYLALSLPGPLPKFWWVEKSFGAAWAGVILGAEPVSEFTEKYFFNPNSNRSLLLELMC
jgi:hypothetical protein